ncbi:MAG: DUF11 domain-containing protein [Betaproteobacteria bacterium]|nr:DUF11 domain-containing protein [Betaproteobacteria bacterium]
MQAPGFDYALRTDDGRIQVMVELIDPPAAVIYARTMGSAKPSDPVARAAAGAASKSQVLKIEAAQATVARSLAASRIGAREIFRVSKALNGIAVAVDPDKLPEIAAISGVKRILPILPEEPTNSTSVPFLGTPSVWANTIGLPAGADGAGIRIGIIDTGIDYLHPAFGGPGLTATNYSDERTDTANFTTVGTAAFGSFPTPKVVGGMDFAGDAYNGGNVPVPDPNPMDCGGHGSHVAGTAAAFGMTAGGATFAGPYDANPATYSGLLVGPGTAPQALLYALRVFGCFGTTGLASQAIDWALDPNGDADLSDHLDVVNMSLGSSFGGVLSATAVAADNAALAGVIMVISAGNSGDTFFIGGSPASGNRVISTAASVDDGPSVVSVTVNSPGSIAGNYLGGAAAFGPAPSGQTANAVLGIDPTAPAACGTDANDGCCALTNAAAMAGNICVVNRGTCGFVVKAAMCQAAGAIGMIVVNNAPGSPPPGMAGTDPTIVIPSELVSLVDGNLLKNTMVSSPPVNVTLAGQNGADTMASFSSRGPRRIFGSPLRLKPDIAAPGLNITSVETGIVCTTATSGGSSCTGLFDPSGIQVGTRALTISGTSMASPHMAGVMALLRQLKPDWSVEELKALAMNYAIHDTTLFANATPPRFGPSRVGAGRVDPALAAVGNVIAMNAEDVGLISVTFNPEVVGVTTQIKKVRIVNKGLTSQTYDLAFDNVVDAPGVAFSVPGGSSVTVPAGSAVVIDVQMSADTSQMDHTRDPSLFPTQGVQANYGDQPRNFLAEEGSYLTFSQGAALKFRLPVYMAEKPASTMAAADTIVTGGAPTGSTTIPLSGTHVCTGTLAAGPTCLGSFPTDVESLVSPFELQVVSGVDPVNSTDYADIRYAGVSYLPGSPSNINNDVIMFGVASWGDWSTPSDVAYNVCVDTDNDGVYDRSVINTNPSIFVAGASANDNFVRVVQNLTTGGFTILGLASPVNLVAPTVIDTALHLNNVMVLGATPAQLGMLAGDTDFRYKVVTCPGSNPGCARTTGANDHCSPSASVRYDEAAGPYFYNWAAQGINFGGNFLAEDLNGSALPVSWNTANMATNGSLGALLLHHHNKAGERAEVVLLDTAQRADLALTKSVTPPNPSLGQNVTFTIVVTNNGPNAATGVVVSDSLPAGLTYVSDDAAGAYDTGTGLWTIPGSIANGAAVTLNIVATVDSTDQVCNLAQIALATPLDPIAANNQSTVCVMAPRSADIVLGMTVSSPTVLVGGTVTYIITATNNGSDPAYAIAIQEAFPAFPLLNPTSFTASQGAYNPATGLWNLGSLPTGTSATLSIDVTAPNTAGALTNQGSASAGTSDPNNANNAASATTIVLSPAVISATKTVAGSFNVGGAVTYTIVLSNSAAFDQQNNTGPELTDVLPAGLTLVSASATSGTAVATIGTNTVTWDGVVPALGSVTVTIQATVNAGTNGTTLTNQGTVNYDADGNGTNEASALTDDPGVGGAANATSFFVVSPAAVSGTKTVSGTRTPGSTVTYTVILSNSGPQAQLNNPGDEFVDVLPPQLGLVSATATSGTAVATVGTNTVTWNGSIPASGSVTITITATVGAVAAGLTVSNQGTINYDADGNLTNESSTQTDDPGVAGAANPTAFLVVSPATVSGTKTVAGTFVAGGNVTYTIVLFNAGPNAQFDNPGNEFVDVLPPQLQLVGVSATSGTAVATVGTNTVTWNGAIPANSSVTVTITATINPNGGGQSILNQGTINFDADGNGTNEASTVTDDPQQPGAADATIVFVARATQVPVLGAIGLVTLLTLLAGLAFVRLRRRSF